MQKNQVQREQDYRKILKDRLNRLNKGQHNSKRKKQKYMKEYLLYINQLRDYLKQRDVMHQKMQMLRMM